MALDLGAKPHANLVSNMRGKVSSSQQNKPKELLLRRVQEEEIPRHVAVIMDGNGRWAQARNRPRVEGHRAGVQAVRETVETAAELKLEYLTLYAFSQENWQRPKVEVWTLMNLLKEYLRRERQNMVDNDIRLQILGRWQELDSSVVKAVERGLAATADCQGMTLNIALNYSGRSEIVDACRRIVGDWAAGQPVDIDEKTLDQHLYTSGQTPPDLMIRTSGEKRISNFLIWQIAYSELWFTDKLWPDFKRADFLQAILDYQSRSRRFGKVSGQSAALSDRSLLLEHESEIGRDAGEASSDASAR